MKKDDIKVIIYTILLILFESGVYFLAKFSPFNLTVLTSDFDSKLPFIPFFACFYYLWFIFLAIIPFILNRINKKYFIRYTSIIIICVIIGALIFLFFPTTINRGVNLDDYNSIFTYLVRFIYFTDNPNLCCLPSMHCALAFVFIYSTLKAKEMKWYYKVLIILSSFAIIVSTLLIKQHVIWDVYAALGVVIISILIEKFTSISKFVTKILEKIEKIVDKKLENTKLGNKLK